MKLIKGIATTCMVRVTWSNSSRVACTCRVELAKLTAPARVDTALRCICAIANGTFSAHDVATKKMPPPLAWPESRSKRYLF